jgi:hypothetical protein
MMRAGRDSVQTKGFDPVRQLFDVKIVLVSYLKAFAVDDQGWEGEGF